MSSFEETGPSVPVHYPTQVDRVHPRARFFGGVRALLAILLMLIGLVPVLVMALTAFKTRTDILASPPLVFFKPSLEGFVYLVTDRAVAAPARLEELRKQAESGGLTLFQRVALNGGQEITGTSDYVSRLQNSLIIAGLSTLASVVLGLFAAYAFSRFPVAGKGDLLFFILSTRMLPGVVVTIPLFLLYRQLHLHDTHFGMILLYTVFNLSFSVWLLKGYIDEIPKEYEEAALVDGYTRIQAFFKIVLPQAITGIAATTVFCLIFAWNEYAFALMMTNKNAQTAPPYIPSQLGSGLTDWTVIAAGSLLFLIPVSIFTFLLRAHLLRGVTFGAIRR